MGEFIINNMEEEGGETCCMCFSLKTGVWLIGALVILSVATAFWNSARYDEWGFFMINAGISAIFCVLFLIMMISQSLDNYKLRYTVFVYYTVGLVLVPLVLTVLAVFGVGWDIVK